MTFPESLEAVRKDRSFKIFEIAQRIGQTPRTVHRWMRGQTSPPKDDQERVIETLRDPKRPSLREIARVGESHHLIFDKQKGWEMRVTVNIKNRSGIRIRTRLKTWLVDEAIIRRDLIVNNMKTLGLTIQDRRYGKRTGDKFAGLTNPRAREK